VLANRDGLTILENFVYGDTPEKAAIGRLLTDIQKQSPGRYEVKIHELSQSLNIRVLPLKTLFVYLDMHGALRPRFSYMKDYDFKQLEPAEEIINRFQGERRDFVATIFNHCQAKKVWTSVDIQAVIENYRAERQRVVAALEYFDEQGMIELRSKSIVEVYEATAESFDLDELTEKMFTIFQERENHETERLQQMVHFFESGSCISHGLARYFGQDITSKACGHCSVCKGDKVQLEQTAKLPPLESHDFTGLSVNFIQLAGERLSVANLTRFLCGIFMPAFSARKVGHLAGAGALENYSFPRVRDWVEKHLKQGNRP
jgi:ATP-dependent DNA helicase RecQ